MLKSKAKRYSLFLLAILLESFLSFVFLNIFSFPLLLPILFFCEIMLYLELSNVVVLFGFAFFADFFMADFLGKYMFVVSLFAVITALLRNKLMPMTPLKFWITYVVIYSATQALAIFVIQMLGYGYPAFSFTICHLLLTALLFPPILSLYAYSFTRRVFVEGRYVKR